MRQSWPKAAKGKRSTVCRRAAEGSAERKTDFEGEQGWFACSVDLQRDRVGSKNGRQRRMGAVRGVPKERKAAEGESLMSVKAL